MLIWYQSPIRDLVCFKFDCCDFSGVTDALRLTLSMEIGLRVSASVVRILYLLLDRIVVGLWLHYSLLRSLMILASGLLQDLVPTTKETDQKVSREVPDAPLYEINQSYSSGRRGGGVPYRGRGGRGYTSDNRSSNFLQRTENPMHAYVHSVAPTPYGFSPFVYYQASHGMVFASGVIPIFPQTIQVHTGFPMPNIFPSQFGGSHYSSVLPSAPVSTVGFPQPCSATPMTFASSSLLSSTTSGV
ncbi:hypothetical protein V6N11_077469 [Hibiscus sabdariffa]|uniref:Uncharacterized protein n=1 Tax=Hibiscus sabdariffa TaxID=183260 RepID=A0ABR2TDB8_9ROSI